jgi:hypothetical protein
MGPYVFILIFCKFKEEYPRFKTSQQTPIMLVFSLLYVLLHSHVFAFAINIHIKK